MSDYFEEKKSESQEDFYEAKKRDTAYWQKRKEEKDLEDKKRYIEMRQKYAGKYDDRYQNVKKVPKLAKPIKKPKPKLTIAQKAARSAKRKRTVKKVYRAIKTFIYGKPKTKHKTTVKKKK